ncbi:MAG: D-alanine--D-alanine ligase [Clostridia bacterium]|nr:D-alanine--D-alanine ligase [Clostridia bacterium]
MKINVGVFFGGASVEHEVAVISAVQAMNSMDTEKYNIVPVYITKQGEMYHSDLMIEINEFKDIPALLKKSKKVTLIKENDKFMLIELKGGLFKKPVCSLDIAFPIVHGTNCEDGSLVGWFELLQMPYVGCDVLSAAVGMDKAFFKYVLNEKDIPVLPCVTFYAKEWVADKDAIIKNISEKFGFPVIVKPANLGSSVGISKADDEDALRNSVDNAMNFAAKILVEPAITSLRELNCSVLGDVDDCEPSVIEEPVMSGEILSYDDKYKSGNSQGMKSLKRKIPADISEKTKCEVEQCAVAAFKALGCNGVVRIDFLMDTANDNKVYINEINTIPGSLSFYLWEPKGVKYKELLTKMIELGFKRARSKANLMFSYDTNILSSGGAFGSKGKK